MVAVVDVRVGGIGGTIEGSLVVNVSVGEVVAESIFTLEELVVMIASARVGEFVAKGSLVAVVGAVRVGEFVAAPIGAPLAQSGRSQ